MVLAHHVFNPYPGLRSFEPEEAHLFFGREKQIQELVTRLDRTRFLAVVGTSGCGKSSLVRAGLLPTLSQSHEGLAGTDWRTLLFKPGNEPFRNLAEAFLGRDEVTGEVPELNQTIEGLELQMRASKDGLLETIKAIHGTSRNLVIVVDQFEELFTFHNSETEDLASNDSKLFVERLLVAVTQSEVPIYLVLTMRSDFLGNCTEFPGLTESINNGQFLIPRMTLDERRAAILGPLQVANGLIADRLVARILGEAGEGQDQLPILQHTLMRMWDYWQKNRVGDQPMDYHEYEAVGGIEKALSLHAEEAFAELDDHREKRLAEVLFKALTDLGADNRGTRRPTQLREIAALAEAEETEIVEVIEVFRTHGRAFLMPPPKVSLDGDTIIDISHESLMRKWGRLSKWVEEEIKSAELYLRLCNSSMLYQQGKTGLLGNPELQLALNWRQENHPNLDWARRYDLHFERAVNFLTHSEAEYNLAIAKKENQQKRELSRARRFTIFLGMAAAVSLVFLLLAFNLMFKAEDSERLAVKQAALAETKSRQALDQTKVAVAQKRISEQQQEIASQQRKLAEKNRNLALEQSEIAKQNEAIANQQRSIAIRKEKEAVDARELAERNEDRAIEQQKIAEANQERAERSEKNTERLRMLAVARNIAIRSYAIDRDEEPDLVRLLAMQAFKLNRANNGPDDDPDIYKALAHATADEQVDRMHSDAVRCLSAATGSNRLISGSEDGEVLLWPAGKNAQPIRIKAPAKGQSVRAVASNAKGNRFAAGDYAGNVQIWNTADLSASKPRQIHNGIVTGLAFHPQKDILFTVGMDSTVRSIDLKNTDKAPVLIDRAKGRITSLAVSANGALLACGTRTGHWSLYDLNSGKKTPLYTGRSNTGGITALGFSVDNRLLAVGTESGRILLVTPAKPLQDPVQLPGHSSPVSDLTFHPQAMTLASVSLDGTGKMWNTAHPEQEPILIDNLTDWAWAVDFSSDGQQLIVGGQDKSVRTMSAKADQMVDRICPELERNLSEEEWQKYIGKDIDYQETCANLPMGDPQSSNRGDDE